jgi:hypothetical protein
MKCNTPVIGKIPRMVPEWMGTVDENGNLNLNDNGIWTANLNSIPDVVAVETSEEILNEVYSKLFTNRTVELQTMVTKLQEQEQETVVTEK